MCRRAISTSFQRMYTLKCNSNFVEKVEMSATLNDLATQTLHCGTVSASFMANVSVDWWEKLSTTSRDGESERERDLSQKINSPGYPNSVLNKLGWAGDRFVDYLFVECTNSESLQLSKSSVLISSIWTLRSSWWVFWQARGKRQAFSLVSVKRAF